jgi:hypothetical protein
MAKVNLLDASNHYFDNTLSGLTSVTTQSAIEELSNHTTDNLAEGTTNLYFTDARATAAITKTTIDALNVDADMIDGLHASQFLRSDIDDTMEANLTVNGNIYAIGDVFAFYSDARLKDFHGTIPDALEKVSQLNGYYYTANETASNLGYGNSAMQVGVSAQEVESILPEITALAPINFVEGIDMPEDQYMTVKYDRMAALFIEAIKELKAENEELKARLGNLENK